MTIEESILNDAACLSRQMVAEKPDDLLQTPASSGSRAGGFFHGLLFLRPRTWRVHCQNVVRNRCLERLTNMASRIAKSALSLLLGLALVVQGGVAVSVQAAAPAKSSCCCSGRSCATRACCAKPRQPSAPFAPASAPTSQNEWQALAASGVLLLAVPSPSADQLSAPVSSFLVVAAVPIFQRDCAYLL
jgi:hypothetical protein